MASQTVGRMLGGSPIAVVGRLVLLSILVGVVLSTVGLDPMNLLLTLDAIVRRVYAMGFDAVRHLWQYFLLGACIVLPLWMVARLIRPVRH